MQKDKEKERDKDKEKASGHDVAKTSAGGRPKHPDPSRTTARFLLKIPKLFVNDDLYAYFCTCISVILYRFKYFLQTVGALKCINSFMSYRLFHSFLKRFLVCRYQVPELLNL